MDNIMDKTLKIISVIALVLVVAVVGKFLLNTEKQKVASHEEHGEHEGHGDEERHDNHEGHDDHGEEGGNEAVELSEEQISEAGIEILTAKEAKIHISRTLYGKLRENEEKIAHIAPRFAGVVLEVKKRLGDKVSKGETMVVIESNESLKPYKVKSLIEGTVIERHVTIGEVVETSAKMFTVADLSTLWVDLTAYPQDFSLLKIGQEVNIKTDLTPKLLNTKIDYISPFGSESTQTMLARASIPNPNGLLRPGLYASGLVRIGEIFAKIAVKKEALQTWENKTVVFVKTPHGFQAQSVLLGKEDENLVEILGGLHLEDKYASMNSFVIKAELGKSMAKHEH